VLTGDAEMNAYGRKNLPAAFPLEQPQRKCEAPV
jgi:hypothetical protein